MSRKLGNIFREVSGAAGDLGTLLPLTIGAIVLGALSPGPVFLGFAVLYFATAAVYRLPIPVQPMKAVAAVLLTTGATAPSVAAAGFIVGAFLVILGATGLIDRLARLVPRSVLSGLQLGLGISLALVALDLMGTAPLFAIAGGVVAAGLLAARRLPAALLLLGGAIAIGGPLGLPTLDVPTNAADWNLPGWPSSGEWRMAATGMALPQLSLTLTNAVILTALVAGDVYGDRARGVTPRRLCLTSGLANLVLAPFGALPMCHGAGGVAAHWRFGARGWGAPVILGVLALALAVLPGMGAAFVAAIPAAALGILLLISAVELGTSRRIFDCQPSCRPVIAATAAATVMLDPFLGILIGSAAEVVRKWLVRRYFSRQGAVERGPIPAIRGRR